MPKIFSRRALAEQMATQLLSPSVLDEGLRSGLFLSGPRRTGKTTFLVNDLIPALQEGGALVIYTDLWSDLSVSPAVLIRTALRKTLEALQSPASGLLARLAQLRGAELGVMGFKFGFKLDHLGQPGGPTLAQVLTEVVDQARTDVLLIVDEVQQAMMSDDGNNTLLALKAARDAINTRPGTPGHFIFIGTGSHRALVGELTTQRTQAFAGAVSLSYPMLDASYVDYLLERMKEDGIRNPPSAPVAFEAFRTLGHRPEEMLKALRLMASRGSLGEDPDRTLPIVAATLRATAADVELAKVEEMGALANAIFDRIASDGDVARGVFSADALAGYARAIGRDVRPDEVQTLLNALVQANLVIRPGHGLYGVSDPFVREIWRERKTLLASG
jgi:hypothetical protein